MEMDRFEGTKQVTLKKYSMMTRPEGKVKDSLQVAVDAYATLCPGKYAWARCCPTVALFSCSLCMPELPVIGQLQTVQWQAAATAPDLLRQLCFANGEASLRMPPTVC